MASLNFIRGSIKGRVGEFVGSLWKGTDYIKTFSPPSNPRTQRQVAIRTPFMLAMLLFIFTATSIFGQTRSQLQAIQKETASMISLWDDTMKSYNNDLGRMLFCATVISDYTKGTMPDSIMESAKDLWYYFASVSLTNERYGTNHYDWVYVFASISRYYGFNNIHMVFSQELGYVFIAVLGQGTVQFLDPSSPRLPNIVDGKYFSDYRDIVFVITDNTGKVLNTSPLYR